MRVIHAKPPLYEAIVAAFPQAAGVGILFTHGPAIYVPHGGQVAPELHAHEEVHCARQGQDPKGWWERYIADAEFRLAEELPAHRAEYRAFCEREKDRNVQSRYLSAIVQRLSGPLYGRIITAKVARQQVSA